MACLSLDNRVVYAKFYLLIFYLRFLLCYSKVRLIYSCFCALSYFAINNLLALLQITWSFLFFFLCSGTVQLQNYLFLRGWKKFTSEAVYMQVCVYIQENLFFDNFLNTFYDYYIASQFL